MAARDPVADLRQIAFLLERANEASYRVRAFRGAAEALAPLPAEEIAERTAAGTLTRLSGVGDVTARCVAESLAGEVPVYLRRLLDTAGSDVDEAATRLREALRGDCHTHSTWSDGGAPIEEMAVSAVHLGHEYMALTDHSPRLTVARGLSAAKLREQLGVVTVLNETLADEGNGFRILTGIEVDILADGGLDQEEDLLAQLDVVVASIHSGLRSSSDEMTKRMLAAIANPHVDILGHCTGRKLTAGRGDRAHRSSRTRPESDFDAPAVFAACVEYGKAVEINCRPDRLDPPKRLLRLALEAGCHFAINTDAHAPGQLDWQMLGCARAAACGVPVERVVNSWSRETLLEWTATHVSPADGG